MIREDWHYTSLKPLDALTALPDGFVQLETSPLPAGVTLTAMNWADLIAHFPSDHPAVMEKGTAWKITVSGDAGTLDLSFLASANAQSAFGLLLDMKAGGSLTLFEQHALPSGLARCLFAVTLAENATLTHTRLQNTAPTAFHLSLLNATLQAGATYTHTTLNLGAALARHEVEVHLAAPQATASFTGLNLLTGTQHGDITTRIYHDAPQCHSQQSVRNVLADAAHGVFQGLIHVAPHAQKTDGQQLSRALLLSPHAEMNAKPELEIYADDVKCSHGATVGALDETALFYLRARGLDETAARRLLVQGFITETLEHTALLTAAQNWLEALP